MTGAQFRKIREALGYTQESLAYAMGYRHPQKGAMVSKWEKDIERAPPPAIELLREWNRKKQ